jgi:TetR/AcrR family transcriptional regulator, repressor for uid operon
MRKRNEKLNSERRKQILQVAAQWFVKRGFHGTSMKDICDAANMSPGTLYHYFESKTEIIAGIIAEEAQIMEALLSPLRSSTAFLQAMSEALDIIASEVTEHDLALHTEIAAEIQRQPALREAQLKVDRQAYAIVLGALIRAQGDKQLDPALDLTHIAKLVLALVDGLLWRATLEGPQSLKDYLPATKEALARILRAKQRRT